jgi:hypothetical protein
MISIDTAKLKLSLKRLAEVRKNVSKEADKAYRQKIYYLLEAAVRVSPQFSGDFASNWAVVVDGNMPVYRPLAGKQTGMGSVSKTNGAGAVTYSGVAHKAGDMEAVTIALARGASALNGVTAKSKIHLVNATELSTDGTRMTGPDGTVNLRPENLIPGRVRIESYVRALAKNPVKLVVPK